MGLRILMLLELKQFFRNRAYVGLMAILLALMAFASWNSHAYFDARQEEVRSQLQLVEKNDAKLIAEIDRLNQGIDTFENSYTLPTSGIRLTFNNHRITWLPFQPLSLIAIGQADLFSNYKKIILYNNDSYEPSSEELVSPLEQLFGQLDLAFVWVYLLPLIILLCSFNVLSAERESGRLSLIASQPTRLSSWLFAKLAFRFFILFTLLVAGTTVLLLAFDVDLADHLPAMGRLNLLLTLYSGFWFVLCFLVNLADYSSGKSLIVLTTTWVLFVFLIPSVVNLLAQELHPIPSRLEVINHHQATYNEVEGNLDAEMQKRFETHPDWRSDDPVTKDLSNSTGWNINYLAKQYIAQLKHRPIAASYERKIKDRVEWIGFFEALSPAMIMQSALTDMAGTSAGFYKGYLEQTQDYAEAYRQYVFQRIFANHAFTSEEIRHLPEFRFDSTRVSQGFATDALALLAYLVALSLLCIRVAKQAFQVH